MKIVNNTLLKYKDLGTIIDLIISSYDNDTHYIGQCEYCYVNYKNKIIFVQIRYFKKYIEWRFENATNKK